LASDGNLNIDVREELDMFTVDIEKLAAYQIGLDKGKEQGREEGRREGHKEGAHAQAVATAKNLLALGLMAVQVAGATGLPREEVEALAAAKPDAKP
jgi:predicted transposase/invertase (TIGR01784 family)